MVLRWLDTELDDLRAIKVYIAEENPDAARRVVASIRSEVGILINQPTIGRAGRIADTRELVSANTLTLWLTGSSVVKCISLP